MVVNGRNAEKGPQAEEEMGGGDRVAFVAGDVPQQTDVEHLVDATVERFGRIDILVNNAGGGGDFAPCVDLSDESWNLDITWNLHATFWGTRRALRYMIPQSFGRIINISSVEGKHGKPAMALRGGEARHQRVDEVGREGGRHAGRDLNALAPG